MTLVFFKRYRMHLDLAEDRGPVSSLPPTYRAVPWDDALVERHAIAKYESFQHELDANVFPCLASLDGCVRLMREISSRREFVPAATWLIEFQASATRRPQPCATIQGLIDADRIGSIQNVGVAPDHRGLGLGTHLLERAVAGFRSLGLKVASLEVTAENESAFRLYQRFGFRMIRTVYKSIELVDD
jgi:GNAT superfamily N-acetyltransferase